MEISVKEAGRRGGLKGGKVTAEKFGHEHFVAIGKKGGHRNVVNKAIADLVRGGKIQMAVSLAKKNP